MNLFSILVQAENYGDEYQQDERILTSHHDETWYRYVRIHGILMIIGWGFCLPVAMASSWLLRHRNQHPSYPFLKFHYMFAGVGILFLAIPGWIIALQNFHVFDSLKNNYSKQDVTTSTTNEDGGDGDGGENISNNNINNSAQNNILTWTTSKTSHTHAMLGMIVMWGAILNILIYPFLMSKPKRANESFQHDFSLKRKIGHMTHRILGHILILLALITCWTGTHVTHSDVTNAKLLKGFIVALIISSCVAILFWIDKWKFRNRSRPDGDRETEEATTDGAGVASRNVVNNAHPTESSVLLA